MPHVCAQCPNFSWHSKNFQTLHLSVPSLLKTCAYEHQREEEKRRDFKLMAKECASSCVWMSDVSNYLLKGISNTSDKRPSPRLQ